ncbi:hypothetical protein M434DRAFT_106707 [Hypoxylon sp. CO27-5]|nr:hypothetical protein M434DRAFT_106707 [Hypoxylon sp. CO27-5]
MRKWESEYQTPLDPRCAKLQCLVCLYITLIQEDRHILNPSMFPKSLVKNTVVYWTPNSSWNDCLTIPTQANNIELVISLLLCLIYA